MHNTTRHILHCMNCIQALNKQQSLHLQDRWETWAPLQYKDCLSRYGIRMVKIRWYHDYHIFTMRILLLPDNKVHGTDMGPIWGRQDPGGPHVGPMSLAMWADIFLLKWQFFI